MSEPASALDSRVLGGILGDPHTRDLWTDTARTTRYLHIEAALAAVEAKLRIIPDDAAIEIARRCEISTIDMDLLRRRTELIGYPVLGVVEQVVAACHHDLGQWVHWGATTQDITDTATVLQLRASLDRHDELLQRIETALTRLAATHRDTPMAGRTNMEQAVPTTFGFVATTWLSGVRRSRKRVAATRVDLLVGEFAGAVGTTSSLGARGPEVRRALCERLGLGVPEIAWHTMRDAISATAAALAIACAVAAKIAGDVKVMAMTELGELSEPDEGGTRGVSSAMPQKRNPISCAYIIATSTTVQRAAGALLIGQATADFQRSTGPWQGEWIALPDLCVSAAACLRQAAFLLEGLVVHPDRMRKNLALTGGLINAEAVMMALAPTMGRERAHDLVHEVAQEVLDGHGTFAERLAARPEVTAQLDEQALARVLDPTTALGSAGVEVDHVLAADR